LEIEKIEPNGFMVISRMKDIKKGIIKKRLSAHSCLFFLALKPQNP